jgi:hypothetical protein
LTLFRCVDKFKGALFLKRFNDACIMREKHREAFETFSSTFKAKTIAVWTKKVEDWINDRTKPNPYEEPQNSESALALTIYCLNPSADIYFLATRLQDVRLELAKEDADVAKEGAAAPHTISLTEFLMKGLELEEQQYVFR